VRRHDGAGGSGEYHLENDHTARHSRNQIKPSKTFSPPQRGRGRCKKINFVLFHVIPEKAGIRAPASRCDLRGESPLSGDARSW
jgi:hypothetical protein